MSGLREVIVVIYVYCTDFIIALANYTGTSYYEVNLYVFVVLYPILIAIGVLLYGLQRLRLRRWRKRVEDFVGAAPRVR